MTIYTTESPINAPAAAVWQAVADFAGVAAFSPAVKSSRATTKARQGVGAGRHLQLSPFGTLEEYVTSWDDPNGYSFEITNSTGLPPFEYAQATLAIDADGPNKSRARLTMDYQFKYGPLGTLADRIVPGPLLRRGVRQFTNGLKAYVERSQH